MEKANQRGITRIFLISLVAKKDKHYLWSGAFPWLKTQISKFSRNNLVKFLYICPKIYSRTLASTLQTSSPILPSSSDSAPLNTSTITAIPIGTFPPSNGQQSIEEKGKGKQEKVPLTKGKGKVGAATKTVPEKSAGNNSGAGQTSTKNGATSRNCNSELMRQIMLEVCVAWKRRGGCCSRFCCHWPKIVFSLVKYV
jgi:hypothetical protein